MQSMMRYWSFSVSKEKVLKTLGLAMRARKLVLGEDLIIQAIRKEAHKLVLLASDAGENITKKITDKSKTYHVQVIQDFTSEELSNAIGKQNRKVILLKDKGFITLLNKQLDS